MGEQGDAHNGKTTSKIPVLFAKVLRERERDENEKDSIRDDTLQTYRREEIGTNREKL